MVELGRIGRVLGEDYKLVDGSVGYHSKACLNRRQINKSVESFSKHTSLLKHQLLGQQHENGAYNRPPSLVLTKKHLHFPKRNSQRQSRLRPIVYGSFKSSPNNDAEHLPVCGFFTLALFECARTCQPVRISMNQPHIALSN